MKLGKWFQKNCRLVLSELAEHAYLKPQCHEIFSSLDYFIRQLLQVSIRHAYNFFWNTQGSLYHCLTDLKEPSGSSPVLRIPVNHALSVSVIQARFLFLLGYCWPVRIDRPVDIDTSNACLTSSGGQSYSYSVTKLHN
jgi:hypothetical protein